jgi:hypothetical protein
MKPGLAPGFFDMARVAQACAARLWQICHGGRDYGLFEPKRSRFDVSGDTVPVGVA